MALHSKILIMLPAGAAGVTARLAWTEDNDVCAISAAASVTSTLAWTEANDGCAISGAATVSAALAWTEANDTLSASGSVTVSASLAWTEADDAYSVSGAVSVTESIAWTETDDVTAISGTVGSASVTADIAWAEESDLLAITGTASLPLISRSDGGEKRRSKKFRKKNENRRLDLERAYAALMESPEASVRAEAREIVSTVLSPTFDASELSDFRAMQLLDLYKEMQDEEDLLILM